mmetsp:Transcript_123851/g.246429  ORF Transcript_123851/g.246429 Transcript_123851/m.246429 type:complete len:463 (+) Transcript_123851:55-1443(+)
MVMAAMGVLRMMVLLSLLPGCACERKETKTTALQCLGRVSSRLIILGQNEWGNLAVGSIAACTEEVKKHETACPPILVERIFTAPVVALGATWTHVLDVGKLYSAGWAGDGACGFSPNIETQGMDGEHVKKLVDASDRWDYNPDKPDMTEDLYERAFADEIAACDQSELNLNSASAAYTSSLLLSSNRRCVFTFGLVGDLPTKTLAIPKQYQGRSGTMKRPLAIFHSSAQNKVRQVVATYSANFLVMDSGEVLRTPSSLQGSNEPMNGTLSWQPVAGLRNVVKMAGNGWTYYGAMTSNGDLLLWSEQFSNDAVPGLETSTSPQFPVVVQGVADFSLGPLHMLVLKPDKTLWSAGSNACGQLGRNAGFFNFGQVPGLWTAACAGYYYSLGLNDKGKMYIWGSITANAYRGAETACNEPGKTHVLAPMPLEDYFEMSETVFKGFPKVDSLSCGFYHAAAVVSSS